MSDLKKVEGALISVFHKNGLEPIVKLLQKNNITIYSTGGTKKFINDLGIDVVAVEDITSYPSILGGRVKTLHPKVFGGILYRRGFEDDQSHIKEYDIPKIDLVIVDLYPFEKTVSSGVSQSEIIEKIDIGGISLIRAAAKNFNDVLVVSNMKQYSRVEKILSEQNCETKLEQRKRFALESFNESSNYDSAIFNYFNNEEELNTLKIGEQNANVLRYGENPHQKGVFYGNLTDVFDKVHGKELSYNNLLDVDSAVNLMGEFIDDNPTFAILKHNNACGLATRTTLKQAYIDALAGDPTSAFGGVLISNTEIDDDTSEEINKLFCEVVIAPSYSKKALELLKGKKNRIILVQKEVSMPAKQVKSILNGYLVQDKNNVTDKKEDLKQVTKIAPNQSEIEDLLFASKICKHTKSNTIVLVKNLQLIGSGTGQTSRIDALNHAITKAKAFKFDLDGAVMASDAFFPFPDAVEMAGKEGIKTVIQPGGSIKDRLSIDYCNANDIAMVFTGTRHFKH